MLPVDDQGYLLNEGQWTPEAAERLARAAGIDPLTDKHWMVLALCREEAARSGRAPNAKEISDLVGLTQARLHELFPGDPARLAARIAGLPRPASNDNQARKEARR